MTSISLTSYYFSDYADWLQLKVYKGVIYQKLLYVYGSKHDLGYHDTSNMT